MDVIPFLLYNTKVKKFFLIFFCFVLVGCQNDKNEFEITINYLKGKAIGISFISKYESDGFAISIEDNSINILGEFKLEEGRHSFTPIVPFTNGQSYHLKLKNEVVGNFEVKNELRVVAPELLHIYPSTDTVPENLLKMYLEFSKPMQEVKSALDFIDVIDENNGEKIEIFLELENELWNREHTILTLWLDPGRIKTDLIPNKEKGLPIVFGRNYTIKISENWKDANGLNLERNRFKTFLVSERNNTIPTSNNWILDVPKSGSILPLSIHFNEYMDAILIAETISVFDTENNIFLGELQIIDNELGVKFFPHEKWKLQKYKIKIESRFEDLSGNNLNHLFDVDLKNNSDQIDQSLYKTIEFEIK